MLLLFEDETIELFYFGADFNDFVAFFLVLSVQLAVESVGGGYLLQQLAGLELEELQFVVFSCEFVGEVVAFGDLVLEGFLQLDDFVFLFLAAHGERFVYLLELILQHLIGYQQI